VSPAFWEQVKANNAQFPRGVDLMFAGRSDTIAALPRSTTVTVSEV
jgi:alpha-D-ribose 1-methylphosphonate 5-triphosphate synthase subunit PhnH